MSITEPEIVVDRLEYYRRERQRMLEREIAAALQMEPTAWSTWKRSYLRDDSPEALDAAIEDARAERDDLDRLAGIAAEFAREHARREHARRAMNEAHGTDFGAVKFRNLLRRAAARGLDGSTPGGPLPEGQVIRGASTLWRYDEDTGEPVKRLEWVKTREDDAQSVESVTRYVESALSHLRGAAPAIAAPSDALDDLAVVYPRPDLHVGLLAWGRETGTDWDLGKAREALGQAAQSLIAAAPPADTALVLGLGDFFHADDGLNRTRQNQNPLDVDSRYAKILEVGVWLEIAKVQLALQRHRRVVYTARPGNHDPHAYRALLIGVRMYFHGEPRVTVDDSPAPFWYWRWGKVLLGATHGDRVKAADLPMRMAADRPQDWAECPIRRYYVGHRHHKAVVEIGGVVIEQFGSPAPPDAWHAAGPWVSGRGLVAIHLHKDRGEIGRQEYAL